ncbi:NADH:ubiquinone oxidoreductase 11.5kD subunit [Dendryphion nanum]|uniref:NADH dehydrogenase [ubiquinone] iron-sulfur protein 5 n=1 Tax=Dendryphion nanum TaxID=256645 RepID=A0A9P9IW08_9PLEO|nr:NADH:ubiquinone oxidoreductase 11.5kD subunit [Dendryphion nanum]
MASGYGLSGGPSRCFPFWQEVLACYVTNTNPEDDRGKVKCQPILEDYYECLHHKKESARTLALQAAYRRQQANIKRDDAPSAGEIRRLGILDAPLEEKNLKASKWFPHKEIN